MSRHVCPGNTCLWKRDFGPEAALCAVRVDPSDARRLCLCGQKGSLIVLRLTNMARDRVEQQTYKVDMSASKPGDALRAVFSTTRDLLYVLLPREASPKPLHMCNSQGTSLCTLRHAITQLHLRFSTSILFEVLRPDLNTNVVMPHLLM